MVWARLNKYVEMWKKPVLGSENKKDEKRYMALCIDSTSKDPYRGIAREIIERKGSPDIPGFLDRSKLIIVESYDLLNWNIIEDLDINGINEIVEKLLGNTKNKKEFIGLEDPDILVDDSGKKHVYFTIAFKYKKMDLYDVYVGHAIGDGLDQLVAKMPVLGKVNNEIVGFKEICPSPVENKDGRFVLTETFVNKGKNKKYSAISVSKAKPISNKWDYIKLVHDPLKESRKWCAGYSSPCRIFDQSLISHNRNLLGIMNGREKTEEVNGNEYYGKFRPGLFLFNPESGDIVWVDNEPLFEDPFATTITFASELMPLNNKEAILYAHINDSFVRAYKLNLEKIKERISSLH